MAVTLPTIQYTARDFETIFQFLSDLVQADDAAEGTTYWNDFFEANIGVHIMDMIAGQGDVLSYVANQISREVFLATCQRYASGLKHAKHVGYKPRMRAAASLSLYAIPPFPPDLQTKQFKFFEGIEVAVGDLSFQLPEDVVFEPHLDMGETTAVAASKLIDSAATFVTDGRAPGEAVLNIETGARSEIDTVDSEIQLTLVDDIFTATGESYAVRDVHLALTVSHSEGQDDTFVSDGTAFQIYTTSEAPVVQDSWRVMVNGIEWAEVESLLIAQTTNVYEIGINYEGKLQVRFGDNKGGKIPPNGAMIQVYYRSGGGLEGNVGANTANGAQMTGYIEASPISQPFNNAAKAAGGADEESLEELRYNIPAWVRTVDKAVTKEDYDTLSRTFEDPTYGAIARAVALLRYEPPVPTPLSGPYGNYVDVYTWAYGPGGTFVPPSLGLKQALYRYLRARRVVTVQVCITDGTNLDLDIDLGDILIDERFVLSEVCANVQTAIDDFFTAADFQPGQSFHISDFYNAVDSVGGVNHFQIQSMSAGGAPVSPPADVSAADTELIVKGTITFTCVHPTDTPPTIGPCPAPVP